MSEESARKAARGGAKICTGFHPNDRVRRIFDAYRQEAARVGNQSGAEQLALRRQVTIAPGDDDARAASRRREQRFRAYVAQDPRVAMPAMAKNTRLIAVANDILHLYRTQSFRSLLLGSYEPLLGFKQVQLENTVQDYEDKISAQRFYGNERPPAVPAAAPKAQAVAPAAAPAR